MKKERTKAQLAADRLRCLNGVRPMTEDESKQRKKELHKKHMENPFYRELLNNYFRKRRMRPEVHERETKLRRERYHQNLEKSRERARENYRKLMQDPERKARRNAVRRKLRTGADGKQSASARREQVLYKHLPYWQKVVEEGREEQYLRRASERNQSAFRMWRNNPSLFFEMMKYSRTKTNNQERR